MLTVGVKKVIVDDVTAVDEESEIESKYLNLSLLKPDLTLKKVFHVQCTGNGMCANLDLLAVALEDMDVAIVTMFPRFVLDEPPEFGRMLDDF